MCLVTLSRSVDFFIAAAASLIALAFAAWVTTYATIDFTEPASVVFIIVVLLWVSVPYFAIAIAALVLSSSWISRVLLVVALSTSALFGLWAYDLIDEDAQGALLVIFVPLYQSGGAFLAIFFAGIAELVIRRRRAANRGRKEAEEE